jgi:hypothetical protein
MGMRLLVVLSVVFASSIAHAQPGMTPPISPPAMTPAQPKQPEGDRKDPSIAVLLSLGVPVAGAIMLGAADNDTAKLIGFGGLLFGPSTGRWYAGEAGGGTLALRTLGGVSMVVGLVSVIAAAESDCDFYDDGCPAARDEADAMERRGMVLFFGGAGLWVGTSIADIVFAKRAADSWNKRHSVSLTPGYVGTGGTRTPGVVLTGRF